MKKMLNLCVIVIICLALCGCTKDEIAGIGTVSKYKPNNSLVSMRIKEGSLTSSNAILILENHTDYSYSYGNQFLIEKEENGVWHQLVPIREADFTLESYGLNAKDSIEIKIAWGLFYGKLPSGKYKIIKSVFHSIDIPIMEEDIVYIAAEFTIE